MMLPLPSAMSDPYTLQLGVRLVVVILCTCLVFFLYLLKMEAGDDTFIIIHT